MFSLFIYIIVPIPFLWHLLPIRWLSIFVQVTPSTSLGQLSKILEKDHYAIVMNESNKRDGILLLLFSSYTIFSLSFFPSTSLQLVEKRSIQLEVWSLALTYCSTYPASNHSDDFTTSIYSFCFSQEIFLETQRRGVRVVR